ncbi:enoyl-CoA hydratase/isomerase family protein [Nocardioides sp. 616]|uniref:enoyl-CoA hydratase/isomerase family protein n=1 Tax=Nocardioides sp. 616 TaxID=2268090 RepID=UPI000CE4227F|nr:enoyl-CoA hydratase/isomerase family protein [Nocardioides sp. 616]
MTEGGLVTYAVDGGVAHLGLNRPGVANTFDLPTAQAFAEAVRRAGADQDVRAVLVTGAGPRFCAGGDVASFVAADDRAAYLHELALELDVALQALAALPKPVVAAVQGAVAGAGLALMLSCDVIVAAEGTKFVFAYPGIGLTPDCGVSYLLPRAVGQQRALGFALSGRPITAEVALDWGLVTEVAADAAARATEVVAGLAAGPAVALGQARRLLRAGWELDRAATGAEEARTISASVSGPEATELIARFVAR